MQNIKTDTNSHKSCFECGKTGASLFTCSGCQKSFCADHVSKHHQDLAVILDKIGQEHDQIQRDLNEKSLPHPFLDLIDKWEEDSIDKIKQAAELAREKVRELDAHRNETLKISFNRITEELQLARKVDNYSEIELEKWAKELIEFRNEFDTPVVVRTIIDKTPPIHLIKIEKIQLTTDLDDGEQEFNTNCFDPIVAGPVSLSDENHLATYAGNVFGGYASVRSLIRYSSNTYVLRFCLESKGINPIFLGVVSSMEPFIPRTYKSPSAYGWRDINFKVNNGVSDNKSTKKDGRTFQSGDEILLTLDCDNKCLGLLHKRTMMSDILQIDLKTCPLPWQIAVTMVGMNDRVRLF